MTQPSSNPHEARLARNHGVEYRGGPVCWDPEVLCEGVCLDCPKEIELGYRPVARP